LLAFGAKRFPFSIVSAAAATNVRGERFVTECFISSISHNKPSDWEIWSSVFWNMPDLAKGLKSCSVGDLLTIISSSAGFLIRRAAAIQLLVRGDLEIFSTVPPELKVTPLEDWHWNDAIDKVIVKGFVRAWLDGSYDVMREIEPFGVECGVRQWKSGVIWTFMDRLVKLDKISLAKGFSQTVGQCGFEKEGREWDAAVADVSGGKALLDSLPADLRVALEL
jgi:hypothetical protein